MCGCTCDACLCLLCLLCFGSKTKPMGYNMYYNMHPRICWLVEAMSDWVLVRMLVCVLVLCVRVHVWFTNYGEDMHYYEL
jgi:hypothetical protein